MNSAQTQITSAKRAPMAMVTALLLAISGHLNSWAWGHLRSRSTTRQMIQQTGQA